MGPGDFDYIFSVEEEQQAKENTDNGMGRLSPIS